MLLKAIGIYRVLDEDLDDARAGLRPYLALRRSHRHIQAESRNRATGMIGRNRATAERQTILLEPDSRRGLRQERERCTAIGDTCALVCERRAHKQMWCVSIDV